MGVLVTCLLQSFLKKIFMFESPAIDFLAWISAIVVASFKQIKL